MSARKVTRADCSGCRDNFYNHNNMGLNVVDGKPRCWSLADATMVRAMDIHIDQRPPYKGIPLTSRPSCYKRPRFVRVLPERITKDGFWK